jgi:hypothetical protein
LIIEGHRALAIEIGSALMTFPLIIWLALYLAARQWSVSLRPILPWLRILRWLGWGFGLALFFVHLDRDTFPVAYGIAMFTFSTGLALPEGWVRRRLDCSC